MGTSRFQADHVHQVAMKRCVTSCRQPPAARGGVWAGLGNVRYAKSRGRAVRCYKGDERNR